MDGNSHPPTCTPLVCKYVTIPLYLTYPHRHDQEYPLLRLFESPSKDMYVTTTHQHIIFIMNYRAHPT